MSAPATRNILGKRETNRPRKTRTRSGCLPCRRRRKKCDGRRPICHLCETKGEICDWGLKVSFHPSRSLELTADDVASLDAVNRVRRQAKDSVVHFSVVDETASITRQFESSVADDSASEESEEEQLNFALQSSLPASPIGFEENEIPAAPVAAIPIIPRTDHPLTPQPSLILDHAVTAPRVVDLNSVRLAYDAPTPIFSTDAGPDAAPFSLGLAISRGASPTDDIAQPVSQGTLVSLMSAFMWETADWCETTDSAKHFSTASIHTMMQSKPFVAAAMSLASRQIDNVKGRPQPRTLELYQYTIGLLLRQDPNEPDPSILAACTLLCVYEMMGSSVMEWRRHLKGCAGLLKMHGWNGDSEGIVRSCFWAFARIDVWAAFSLDQTTLIPTSSWIENDSVELVASRGNLDDYCNLTTLMFARIVNLLNGTRESEFNTDPVLYSDKVKDSWAGLQLWRRCRLQEAHPILDTEASGSNPFPTIVYTRSSSICGNTFYHAACILLLQTGLITEISALDPPEVLEPVWHAMELGGISQSNPSHANWVNHLQPLYIAGRVFVRSPTPTPHPKVSKEPLELWSQGDQSIGRASHVNIVPVNHWSPQSAGYSDREPRGEDADFAAEKLALLKHLALIERETGWKTSERARDLRILWGLEN